jgi:hypothetical protein
MSVHPDPCGGPGCHLCWLAAHDPRYQRLWASAPTGVNDPAVTKARTAPAARLDCRHRGSALREAVCPSCRGLVRLKVFACTLHGECTLGKSIQRLACCATCPDYAPPEPEAPAESAP